MSARAGMTARTRLHAAPRRARQSRFALRRQPTQHRFPGRRRACQAPAARAVGAMPKRRGIGPWRPRFQGISVEGSLGGERALLLLPGTYMNESGRAVAEAAHFYKLGLSEVVVFHDEIDLPPGKVRVKTGGGTAGHNGLRSISAHIGNEYRRVRIGVGHPGVKDLVHGYVLNDFAKDERTWVEALCAIMADNAELLAKGED